MSGMERNKGTLRYMFDFTEEKCKQFHEDNDYELIGSDYRESLLEHCWEEQMVINNKVYAVWYKIEAEADCYSFAEVNKINDRDYAFHTLHYNSCGLSEVIEGAINEITN